MTLTDLPSCLVAETAVSPGSAAASETFAAFCSWVSPVGGVGVVVVMMLRLSSTLRVSASVIWIQAWKEGYRSGVGPLASSLASVNSPSLRLKREIG